jgi:hypothetical protein
MLYFCPTGFQILYKEEKEEQDEKERDRSTVGRTGMPVMKWKD